MNTSVRLIILGYFIAIARISEVSRGGKGVPGTGITLSTLLLPPYKVLSGARSPHPSLCQVGSLPLWSRDASVRCTGLKVDCFVPR